jgi:hypothetical protein
MLWVKSLLMIVTEFYLQVILIIATLGAVSCVIGLLNNLYPGDQEFENTEFPNEEDE